MRDGGKLLVEGDEQGGITRSKALKVGAASVFGAALGSLSFMPGRARAGTIQPVACRPGQGYRCGTAGMTPCSTPGSNCGCATIYTGSKLEPTTSYCVDFQVCCSDLNTCPGGQKQCPPGYTCSATTCCGEPVCLPPCGTSVGSGTCCLTPVGNNTSCGTCTGGDCFVGFPQCSPCGGPSGLGYYCFTTTEGMAVCGANSYCDEVPSCSSSSDCPAGSACITSNGCTGCSNVGGVCVPLCTTSVSTPNAPRKGSGLTAANIRY